MATPKPQSNNKKETAQLQIPVEEFIRTRDSVVSSLNLLSDAVRQLLNKYIQHTNTILGGEASDSIAALATITAYNDELRATPAGTVEVGKPKRKRGKKAEKDPNAPKRPLTAYFLFSQEARADIKGEMDEPTNKEVNDEVLKQWSEMTDDQKQVWKDKYEINRLEYAKKKKAYDIAKKAAEEDEADAAAIEATLQAAAAGLAEPTKTVDVASGTDSSEEEESSEDEDDESEPSREPSPVKEPTPPPAKTPRKKKATAAPKSNGTAKATPAKATPAKASSPAPAATKATTKRKSKEVKEASPEEPKTKRARKSKGAEDEEAPTPAAEDKKKAKKDPKKKRKSEA